MKRIPTTTRTSIAVLVMSGAAVGFVRADQGSGSSTATSATAGAAGGDRIAANAAPENAALLYYQAWTMYPPLPPELTAKFDDGTLQAMILDSASWEPPAELTKSLLESQQHIELLLHASRIDQADFGPDWSQCFDVMFTHLGHLVKSGQLLACDARRCIHEDKLSDAVDRVEAIYRMARHATVDPIADSSMRSMAIARNADTQARALLDLPGLSAADLSRLTAAVQLLSSPDAFACRRAIINEQDHWYGPNGCFRGMIAKFLEAVKSGNIPECISQDSRAMSILTALVQLDENIATNIVEHQIDQVNRYYDDVLNAWDEPDAVDRLKDLFARVQAGEYGAAAKEWCGTMFVEKRYELEFLDRHAELLRRMEHHRMNAARDAAEGLPSF